MNVRIPGESHAIKVNGRVVGLSHPPKHFEVLEETVLVLLYGWGGWMNVDDHEPADVQPPDDWDPEISIPNGFRNVIALDDAGAMDWVVPGAPEADSSEEPEPYYLSLWCLDDEIWVRNANDHSYRLDPESGEILESLPADHLRIGDRTVEFDGGWVDDVLRAEETIVVMLRGSGHPSPSSKNLYGFDPDGSERWWIGEQRGADEPRAPGFTTINVEDGEIVAAAQDGCRYRINPADGTVIEKTRVDR